MSVSRATTGSIRKSPGGSKRAVKKPSKRSKGRTDEPGAVEALAQNMDQPADQLSFSPEQWQEMVSTAAYFRAERRGFESGSPLDDWFEAESELRRAHGIE